MAKVDVALELLKEVKLCMPVNWSNKDSIKNFRVATDKYAKWYQKGSLEEQGETSEIVSQ